MRMEYVPVLVNARALIRKEPVDSARYQDWFRDSNLNSLKNDLFWLYKQFKRLEMGEEEAKQYGLRVKHTLLDELEIQLTKMSQCSIDDPAIHALIHHQRHGIVRLIKKLDAHYLSDEEASNFCSLHKGISDFSVQLKAPQDNAQTLMDLAQRLPAYIQTVQQDKKRTAEALKANLPNAALKTHVKKHRQDIDQLALVARQIFFCTNIILEYAKNKPTITEAFADVVYPLSRFWRNRGQAMKAVLAVCDGHQSLYDKLTLVASLPIQSVPEKSEPSIQEEIEIEEEIEIKEIEVQIEYEVSTEDTETLDVDALINEVGVDVLFGGKTASNHMQVCVRGRAYSFFTRTINTQGKQSTVLEEQDNANNDGLAMQRS